MKKTALTFGLFTLVMVATSFANPENISSSKSGNKYIATDIDGQFTGHGKRKQDFQSNNLVAQINLNKSEGFRQDRQSVGVNKKID